jgi:hypothetical protein
MGSLATRARCRSTALGCQIANSFWSASPAAARYSLQSRPGAAVSSSARVQWLLFFFTSDESFPRSSALPRCAARGSAMRAASGRRVREVRDLEHLRDVRLVRAPDVRHAAARVDVVRAVGMSSPPCRRKGT